MTTIDLLVYITVGAPLLGFIVNGLFGRYLGKLPGWIATLMLAISATSGGYLAYQALFNHLHVSKDIYTWVSVGNLHIPVGYLIDPLTGVMLFVVTFVSLWIHLYSIGYMAHDKGYWRYFAYLNMFVFFMLLLVLGNNFRLPQVRGGLPGRPAEQGGYGPLHSPRRRPVLRRCYR